MYGIWSSTWTCVASVYLGLSRRSKHGQKAKHASNVRKSLRKRLLRKLQQNPGWFLHSSFLKDASLTLCPACFVIRSLALLISFGSRHFCVIMENHFLKKTGNFCFNSGLLTLVESKLWFLQSPWLFPESQRQVATSQSLDLVSQKIIWQ